MLLTSRRALANRTITLARRHTSARFGRRFVLSASSQVSLSSFHPSDATSTERVSIALEDRSTFTKDDYVSTFRQQKYKDLLDNLNGTDANPDLTWTCYVDLLDYTRSAPLPLEIHQRVLRSCTPETRLMRKELVHKLATRRRILDNPHRYEGRFLTVINNIRKAGYVPALDDYEFILSHFAAVGHHVGAAQVLQEVIKTGLEPRTRTFGLCLQAIAYRLTLPCRKTEEEKFREQCSQLCLHIASLIRRRLHRVPSGCLDLILRIMKDTGNPDVFNSLLKLAYGIDLDYLDRHPLVTDGGLGEPEPFSTAAFTTLVDFLGRQSQVSKMVAAFEVLSNPLRNNSDTQSSFDDDDDDDSFPLASPGLRPLPSARPNTTTINTLIRHCAVHREIALVKHYVLQALELDYSSSAQLQSDIRSLPIAEAHPPRLRVNVDTFRSVLGIVKRNSDLGLLKWLLPHFRMARRRKKQDLEYYSAILENPDADVPVPTYPRYPGGFLSEYGSREQPSQDSLRHPATNHSASEGHTEPPVTFFTPSTPSAALQVTPDSSREQAPQTRLDDSLEPAPAPTSPDPHMKQFDLAAHVQVLQRDVQSMRVLDSRIGSALSRFHIRRKERLGRRIWAGRNVFVRDSGQRVLVSREAWMEIVNFDGEKPRQSLFKTAGNSRSRKVDKPATS